MAILSAEDINVVLYAAKPLTPDRREAFIADVVATLRDVPVIGPGIVHRAIVTAQRAHFDPPHLNGGSGAPRWSR
jgi:hypothetical protein